MPAAKSVEPSIAENNQADEIVLGDLLAPLRRHATMWLGAIVLAGAAGAAGSYLITPQFTSTTTFLPPQQQQSSAASALASLGGLASLGAIGGVKSPADQYISLMQSVAVRDRMVDRFKLMDVYQAKFRIDARKELASRTQMSLGKKDNLITVAVEDTDPKRAAAMANEYVEELRRMTSTLAVSEAQQRRVFFEKQMQDTKSRLIGAQQALQQSGINAGDLKTEPKAAAEQYAQLRAQATAADIKLQTLQSSLADTAPEVRQQAALALALRAKLDQLESSTKPGAASPDYVTKYREFKYQETLFDLMAKQYELARVDESREGALIQVVDVAQPAELKSKPRRAFIAVASAFVVGLAVALTLIVRDRRRAASRD
ncbi:MAG TPA: Wzz/FepE/Etk N-terminal domain-containing protein [Roseateles sp.]|nr:Wzz/FepE/Etk N-terminal domain-containing protein [Roseateles sp.]